MDKTNVNPRPAREKVRVFLESLHRFQSVLVSHSQCPAILHNGMRVPSESSSFTGRNQSSRQSGQTVKKHNNTALVVRCCQPKEEGNRNLKECLYKDLGKSFVIIVGICALAAAR